MRLPKKKFGKGHALEHGRRQYAYKLMAYKDEYEVARLYTNGEFTAKLKQQFEGDFSISSTSRHLCSLRKMDKVIWSKRNMVHGSGMPSNSWQNSKGLRGTNFDIFGYTEERQKNVP